MASTLRAHGPPPAIRALMDSGSHMCDPYGAGALVSASHHADTERLRTGLLRSYNLSRRYSSNSNQCVSRLGPPEF